MNNDTMTLDDVAYAIAKHSRITRDEPMPDELKAIKQAVIHLAAQEAKTGEHRGSFACPCEPSGSDGLFCPGADGKLLCDPAHKPEQARGEILDAPAKVGVAHFATGIPWSTVIACAQRAHAHKDDPKLTTEQVDFFRSIVEKSPKQFQPKTEQAVGAPVAEVVDAHLAAQQAKNGEGVRELSVFVMDGVTVQIHGDQESLDRVMERIQNTSDRLGNFIEPKPEKAVGDGVNDMLAQLAAAKTKLARASGLAGTGPSKLWKREVNSAMWDINCVIYDLTRPCPAIATPADVTDDMVKRFKIAARALVREQTVYAEDVETIHGVLRLLEFFAAQSQASKNAEVTLPDLPKATHVEGEVVGRDGAGWEIIAGGFHGYTEDQMREYGEACVHAALASPSAGMVVPDAIDVDKVSYGEVPYAEGWNACRDAMIVATPEVKP